MIIIEMKAIFIIVITIIKIVTIMEMMMMVVMMILMVVVVVKTIILLQRLSNQFQLKLLKSSSLRLSKFNIHLRVH